MRIASRLGLPWNACAPSSRSARWWRWAGSARGRPWTGASSATSSWPGSWRCPWLGCSVLLSWRSSCTGSCHSCDRSLAASKRGTVWGVCVGAVGSHLHTHTMPTRGLPPSQRLHAPSDVPDHTVHLGVESSSRANLTTVHNTVRSTGIVAT